MSDPTRDHRQHDDPKKEDPGFHEAEHHSFIHFDRPRQVITIIVLAFAVPVIVIFMLAFFVASGQRVGAGAPSMAPEAIETRIRPVAGFELRDASAPRVLASGEQVYKVQCSACHTPGAAGAPRTGDNAAWAPRLQKGFESLLAAAVKGLGAMPPQVGGEFNEAEIARAVVYMANASGGNFPEPPAPAATAQAPAGGPAAPAPAAAAPAAPAAPAPAAPAPAATAPAAPATAAAPAPPVTPGHPPAASAPIGPTGKPLYDSACAVCHIAGVAGAPRLEDQAAWAPRLERGLDALVESVVKGKGAMPPMGGAAQATQEQIRAAVQYMIARVKP